MSKKNAPSKQGAFSLKRESIPLGIKAFPFHFTGPTDTFGFFAKFLFGRLFIISAQFHFAKAAFTLHFLFQNAQRLLNIIVVHNDRNDGTQLLPKL